MNAIELSESDLRQHIVKIGFDIFPQIDIANERTRLNMYAEGCIQRFPHLFERLISGTNEFRISRAISKAKAGLAPTIDTLAITPRGPVFTFPVKILGPTGECVFESEAHYRQDFSECSDLFFSLLPNRQKMRIGLVRELLFTTGQTSCVEALTTRTEFAGAALHGGQSLLVYRDEKYNVRIKIMPAQLMEATSLPVGATVRQDAGYGVQVVLDVNNAQLRPLEKADMEEVLDRADGLWPERLLEYLTGSSQT